MFATSAHFKFHINSMLVSNQLTPFSFFFSWKRFKQIFCLLSHFGILSEREKNLYFFLAFFSMITPAAKLNTIEHKNTITQMTFECCCSF